MWVRLGVVLSQLVAWRIRRRLGEQERVSRIALLARQEVESLDQTRELFDGGHYDLSVVEGWRALEARLRQVLLSRKIETRAGGPEVVIHIATRKGILKQPTLGGVMWRSCLCGCEMLAGLSNSPTGFAG
jgi:hypothetical protein